MFPGEHTGLEMSRRIRLIARPNEGPSRWGVDTLMGVLGARAMRCIDCLCFWAPRNTTSTAPARPLALGPFLFGAIACPPLLRFNGAMPRDPYIREKFTRLRITARKLAANTLSASRRTVTSRRLKAGDTFNRTT